MLNVPMSIAGAFASALLAMLVSYFLVRYDFFLPRFVIVRPGRSLIFSRVLAASWVLAVAGVVILAVMAVPKLLALLEHLLTQPAIVKPQPFSSMDPVDLWKRMGLIARTTVVILFIMSGWSIGVAIDRWFAYDRAQRQSKPFTPAVARALREGRIDEAIRLADLSGNSHVAKVIKAGLRELNPQQNEARRLALRRTEDVVHADLKRRLHWLATIGSTAPIVGLFGTVMGILHAFIGIANSQPSELARIAGSIAEALVTTAIGLLIAVPVVYLFKYLDNRAEAFNLETGDFSAKASGAQGFRP